MTAFGRRSQLRFAALRQAPPTLRRPALPDPPGRGRGHRAAVLAGGLGLLPWMAGAASAPASTPAGAAHATPVSLDLSERLCCAVAAPAGEPAVGSFTRDRAVFTGSGRAASFTERTGVDNPLNGEDVGSYSIPTLADLDGDGDLDLISGEYYGTFRYFENVGTALVPSFTERTGADNPLNGVDLGRRSTPTLGDLDGDGDLDLISGERDGAFFYFENEGTALVPSFTARTGTDNPLDGEDVGILSTPTLVDLDGDGDLDLISGENSGTFFYFENVGTALVPSFTERTTGGNPLRDEEVGSNSAPTLVDLDGDGDLDLISGAFYGTFFYFENVGIAVFPVFTERTGADNPLNGADVGAFSTPTLGDLDGDGDRDLISGEFGGTFKYFENTAVTLPVELARFTVRADGHRALLHWQTASETDNAGFEVEVQHRPEADPDEADPSEANPSGADPAAWTSLAYLAPAAGPTTTQAQAYHYETDALPPGRYGFRLKQLDLDGSARYSEVVEVLLGVVGQYALSEVFPSPFRERARFTLSVPVGQAVEIGLYDALGRRVQVVHRGVVSSEAAHGFVVAGDALPSGLYVLLVEGEHFREARSLILVK